MERNLKNIIMDEDSGIEILSKRGRREKHFLQKDGLIVARMYSDDIHFKKNGKYLEIDNRLEKIQNYYKNINNSFDVYFNENSMGKLVGYELSDGYISFELLNSNIVPIQVIDSDSKYTQKVKYENVFDGVDFEYVITPTKVKENIVIKNKDAAVYKISFSLNTDLELKLNNDGSISALKNNKILFILDTPYIIDSNNKFSNNIKYKLNKNSDGYILDIILNTEWLKSDDVAYPVVIDPTISTYSEGNVYDTYIYSGDTNTDRNSLEYLKVGVERINNQEVTNRALIKFDLPTIGTGSQVYEAYMTLTGYPRTDEYYLSDTVIDIHMLTSDWTEESANWETMNNMFSERIESIGKFVKGHLEFDGLIYYVKSSWNITNLVKNWYIGQPNYGVLLKTHNEVYSEDSLAQYYSKNNSITTENPKPTLLVKYRNYNGIEDYMDYQSQTFTDAEIYENIYNGNIVGKFELGETTGNDAPVSLSLFYNTNDVVLNNNYGFGKGFKLSLWQTIKKVIIDNTTYLEYMDEDGTIHYFSKENDSEEYRDEENLNMTIEEQDLKYVLTDAKGNNLNFTKLNNIGYLMDYIDASGNKTTLYYNSDNKIYKVVDSNNSEININYGVNEISITGSNKTTTIIYENGLVSKISNSNGELVLSYNENSIITRVMDKNGLSIVYDYYEQKPYRIRKVTEYGLNNTIGSFFTLIYGNKATTIIDNTNKTMVINFNDEGNAISTCHLKNHEDVIDAYASLEDYGEYDKYKNRLLSSKMPIGYVNNLLENSSFEESGVSFTPSDDEVTVNISSDCAYSGTKSLNIQTNGLDKYATQSVNVPKGQYYTFSVYIKNSANVKISLEYNDKDGILTKSRTREYYSSNEFIRRDVTIFYPEDATSNLFIKIYLITSGNVYLDDMQLEEGEVVNQYNYISNSNFSKGIEDWNAWTNGTIADMFQVVSLGNNSMSALKIKLDPEKSTSLSKTFKVTGTAGDKYTVSFWYKNKGISMPESNDVLLIPNYTGEYIGDWHPEAALNSNNDEWQYYSKTITTETTYDSIDLFISQQNDANEMYITNVSLFKNVRADDYDYDTKGNVISTSDTNQETSTLEYDSNSQVIKETNSSGENTYSEYDNNTESKEITHISGTGISKETQYDVYGNSSTVKISKKIVVDDISNGLYKIRLKGTKKYIRFDKNGPLLKECNLHDKWKLEKADNYYKISHSILDNKYLSVQDNFLTLSAYQNDNSLFSLTKQNNGSYLIVSKSNGKCLKISNNSLVLEDLDKNKENEYQFYIEFSNNNLFLEENTEYTSDGKYVQSTIDNELKRVTYDVDSENGLTKSETNSKKQTTHYEYDNSGNVTLVRQGSKTTQYEYNNNQLSKIIDNNLEYSFDYNDFIKNTNIKIGNNTLLMAKNYIGSSENISSIDYGNNQSVSYEYDEFDRLKAINKMNNTYNYIYDKNNELAKITSNDDVIKYKYDNGKRLIKCEQDNFEIDYSYGTEENITKQKYTYNDYLEETIQTVYDNSDNINKVSFDYDNNIKYTYDELGRIIKSSINDLCNTTYEYVSNGKRGSLLTKTLNNNGDKYKYKYDSLDNITHIYHNDFLENRYYYNEYNELMKEHNYLTGETIVYKYDVSGNILSKSVYSLNSYNLIYQNKYKYKNAEWKDQLTEFNGETLTYDEIGNLLTKGDNIEFNWINGKELDSYSDSTNEISYKYNKDGIRTRKIVNGKTTNYYLDNDRIVVEKTSGNMLYYIRNTKDNLIGFKYKGKLYYYVKNNQNDIIGILDETYKRVATYNYDSWGNIISVVDENGDDVATDNTHIANINPFRYRSYYFDSETGLYYLNSRYYCPETGRFISADSPETLLEDSDSPFSTNLYVYCNNNPVNAKDNDGYGPVGAILGGLIGCGLGALLIPYVADRLRLKGWKRKVFIAGGTAALTALGAVVGNYLGSALLKMYAKGSRFASKINLVLSKGIARLTGFKYAGYTSGQGYKLTRGKYLIRIMSNGGGRTNYFRVSHKSKGTMTITGKYSSSRAYTHINITINNLIKLVTLARRLK